MTEAADFNTDLLAFMPLDSKRVLEIGCGAGLLARAYRERNPNAHYVAVELDEAMAKQAREEIDHLIEGDFESLSNEEIANGGQFDLIVLGDVAEHFRDAEVALRRLKELLTDDGRLVLSFRNIGHWTAIFNLMHGRWPNDDDGLFQRSQVRRFTLHAMQHTIEAAGFRLLKVRPRSDPIDKVNAERWIPRFADLAVAMGLDRNDFQGRLGTTQYVQVQKKATKTVPPLIHLGFAALAPLAMDVRTRLPTEQLRSIPELVVHYQENGITLPQVGADNPKLLVIQRPGRRDPEQWSNMLADIIRKGWLIINEFDDHPDLASRVLKLDPNDPNRDIALRQVHAIQTSTPVLAETFRALNPEVAAFPNCAFQRQPFLENREGPPTVFYGALNRGEFAVRLAEALAPAIAAVPDLTFDVVHDRAFFDALPTANKRFHELAPYDRYSALLRYCSMALLPLEGQPDELFKSDLKYVESGAASVAVIASPAVYTGTIREGETGLIAHTLDDWAPALIRLATNHAERTRIARAAWEDVGTHRMFADQISLRMDWYRDLWRRRDALNASLRKRVPGLGKKLRG